MVFPPEIRLKLKNFITSHSGLYFRDHDLKNLEDAVVKRMEICNFDSAISYYAYLTASENKESEFRELLNLLTINHTYFFRNESQFNALKKKVLLEIIRCKVASTYASGQKPALRIWSAGCSTGEESYSIAMVVKDAITDIENWDIQIIATDASTDSLEKARRGVYNLNAVKMTNQEYLVKYFDEKTVAGRVQYEVNSPIKTMVKFAYHNLVEEDFAGGFDIIFCRNVVIYFNFETTVKIMHKFWSSLIEGGFLFIGYSENLQFMRDKFQMVDWQEAIYYRKTATQKGGQEVEASAIEKEERFDAILDELSRSQLKADLDPQLSEVIPIRKLEDILVDILKLIHLKKYSEALDLINNAVAIDNNNAQLHYLAAQVYMNQGRAGQARSSLLTAIKLNPLSCGAHYLFGCLYLEEDNLEAAKERFKKALYLEKDFSLAHFYLANIYKEEGNLDNAAREYRNTLKSLSNRPLGDILAYSGGFNVATLVSACRDDLERLKLGI